MGSAREELAIIARRIHYVYLFAMVALIARLLLLLREIFLAVSTPRHAPLHLPL